MSTDHKAEAEDLLNLEAQTSDALLGRDAAQVAQVHATLALVQATEKQTAAISLIIAAMQTGMTNHQRAEFDRGLTRDEAEE